MVLIGLISDDLHFGEAERCSVWLCGKGDFGPFSLGERMVVLKGLILNISLLLGGCGCVGRTDFGHFFTLKDVIIFNNQFWIIVILGRCGCLERTDFGQFSL